MYPAYVNVMKHGLFAFKYLRKGQFRTRKKFKKIDFSISIREIFSGRVKRIKDWGGLQFLYGDEDARQILFQEMLINGETWPKRIKLS